MKKYIEVPLGLTVAALEKEFGAAAVDHYQHRILERMEAGHIYKNPLKTIWLWAMEDRQTGQGFWTTYRGHTCRRKKYGGS